MTPNRTVVPESPRSRISRQPDSTWLLAWAAQLGGSCILFHPSKLCRSCSGFALTSVSDLALPYHPTLQSTCALQCRTSSGLSAHPANAYGMCFCRVCNIDLRACDCVVTRMRLPTDRQLDVLLAAQMREAGRGWKIQRSDALDCIDCGWLTDDYYLTDAAKRLLQSIERHSR